MDNITREEYDRIMLEHDDLVEIIISRTEELANILHDRDPCGTCCETDFETNDDGTLLVQFEDYWHGESDMDSYHLPLEFLFSEDFRKNYKTEVLNKREEDRKQISAGIIEREKILEDHDKAEYERLRKKYETTE